MKTNLQELLKNSYAPYSKVNVAAVVVTKKGKEFPGVNIENAAYPSGICAERSALFAFATAGGRKGDIKELHLTSSTKQPLMPCGACRQVMTEFMDSKDKVIIHHKGKIAHTFTIDQIIPGAVHQEDLK